MLLNYQDLSPVKKSVEIEIPAERIASEATRVTNEFGKQASLPGFRPGKVPAALVRSRFAKEIQEEVMSRLLPRSFHEAIAEKQIQVVGDPSVEHMDPFIEGAPLKYKAEFEVKPFIELREYRGIEIDEPKVEVNDGDIDAMVDRLREQASSYRPETERGLADGDYAMIEITTSGEGIDPETKAGHFRSGEESPMPELHAAMFGRRVGENASFDKVYGDEAANESFRGKNIHHEVTLKEIRVQEKPEVNDEFAKSVGGWDTTVQMREAIREDIRRHREQEGRRAKQGQISDRLLADHEMEVPDVLVEQELGKSLQNYARFLASQGVNLDEAEMDWTRIRDDFRPEAVKRVKRSLILDEIAKKEKIVVSDVEVDAEIRKAAQENGREFAEVKHHLKHEGGYESLRASLGQEKALDFLVREARVRTV